MAIIGAPLDLGQSRRGVDMGPSAIRYAGLEERLQQLGLSVDDHGNVATTLPEGAAVGDERMHYLAEILETCGLVSDLVRAAVASGARPLVLGGDHSVALGTLSGLAAAHGVPGGVIWIDAHGDLNRPETSPSGNVHGMPLAAAAGLAGDWFTHPPLSFPAVDPSRIAIVGARSLDPAERALVREAGIRVFTMSEIDRIGIERTMHEALDRVASTARRISRSSSLTHWRSARRPSAPSYSHDRGSDSPRRPRANRRARTPRRARARGAPRGR